MIMKPNIITDLKIHTLQDLHKLQPFLEDGTLKINKSQIARELSVNRKTVDKYLHGFKKSDTREKPNCLRNHLKQSKNCFLIITSRYSTTKESFGNTLWTTTAMKVLIPTL